MAKVTRRPHYQIIRGMRCPAMFSSKCFQEALDYKPNPDDVFIMTYPKCGTTWMQNIALYIFRKGKEMDDPRDFSRLCPFIDAVGKEGMDRMPRPGAFKTHLPYTLMPYSPEAKYIIVLRNPKDCCVSLYYHAKMNPSFGYWEAEFDDFFELFMAGEVEYNDYFDHLMTWYPHRNDKQIFFTTYEEMKKDAKSIVFRLAEFLGKEYSETIQKDNLVLNNILHFSSFDYMKKNISENFNMMGKCDDIINNPNVLEGIRNMAAYTKSLNIPENLPQMEFVRKGVIGDWKSHLSAEQSERLNKKFLERTEGTEIKEMYLHLM